MPVLRLHEPGMLVGALRLLRTGAPAGGSDCQGAQRDRTSCEANQPETGSVMTAMEEGTQQVIQGRIWRNKQSDRLKISQVSNRI